MPIARFITLLPLLSCSAVLERSVSAWMASLTATTMTLLATTTTLLATTTTLPATTTTLPATTTMLRTTTTTTLATTTMPLATTTMLRTTMTMTMTMTIRSSRVAVHQPFSPTPRSSSKVCRQRSLTPGTPTGAVTSAGTVARPSSSLIPAGSS